MKQGRKNILWLVSWYPNPADPLTGDFIERHARAARMENNVHVIFVNKGQHYQAGNAVSAAFKYLYYFRKYIKQYIAKNGRPDLVHVHISWRAGLAALYCKWFLKLPYVITEHWTAFCKDALSRFSDKSFLTRWFIRRVYKNASKTSAVSEYLANALQQEFDIPKPMRIPNVVDTATFFPSPEKSGVFRFIHISLLNYQKNPEHIFEAAVKLKSLTSRPFELVVYGPRNHATYVTGYIHFRGEVGHDVLSQELRKSHALILYSRYETFGCVIIEAYASGVPVIVSDIPVMHEIVHENTGVFAEPENPEDLAVKMLWMMNNHQSFDPQFLATEAEEKYGFPVVARQFSRLYALD